MRNWKHELFSSLYLSSWLPACALSCFSFPFARPLLFPCPTRLYSLESTITAFRELYAAKSKALPRRWRDRDAVLIRLVSIFHSPWSRPVRLRFLHLSPRELFLSLIRRAAGCGKSSCEHCGFANFNA